MCVNCKGYLIEVTIIEDRYYKPGESVTYNPGDSNYTNWYVVKDNGDTLTLISNRSLYTNMVSEWITANDYLEAGGIAYDSTVGYNDLGALTVLKYLNDYVSSWSAEAKKNVRILSIWDIFEILGINEYSSYSPGTEIYFDTRTSIPPVLTGISKYHWLFDNTLNCKDYGCEVDSPSIATSNYWLDGFITKDVNAFMVSYKGSMNLGKYVLNNNYLFSNIRPVITVPKSSIQ